MRLGVELRRAGRIRTGRLRPPKARPCKVKHARLLVAVGGMGHEPPCSTMSNGSPRRPDENGRTRQSRSRCGGPHRHWGSALPSKKCPRPQSGPAPPTPAGQCPAPKWHDLGQPVKATSAHRPPLLHVHPAPPRGLVGHSPSGSSHTHPYLWCVLHVRSDRLVDFSHSSTGTDDHWRLGGTQISRCV